MIVVVAVVAAKCVIQESVLKNVNQKEISHTRGCDEEIVRKRKRDLRREMRRFITHFTEK